MMRMVLLLALSVWLLSAPLCDACTALAFGKDATVDGSVIVSHTDDAGEGTSDLRLVRVPAKDHREGTTRPVYSFVGGYPRVVAPERSPLYAPAEGQQPFKPLGHIPQVKHTYGYFDNDYGLMNDQGLTIAESTGSAKTVGWSKAFDWGHNLFDISELTKVALERCRTARCAVQTMGDLAVAYGFYSNSSGTPWQPDYADSGEIVTVADTAGEVWVFHVLTGEGNMSAVWAAQRVPDGHVAAIANEFSIRKMDLSDSDNFLASKNVKSFARKMGWWDPKKGEFDFSAAYVVDDPIPLGPLYVGRRQWRVYSLLAPSIKLDPRMGAVSVRPAYPFSVPVDKKVAPADVMRVMRDYYEGTPYDMTKGLAAGPWGDPSRPSGNKGFTVGGWERTISIFRCSYSFVGQVRPHASSPGLAGVMWYGLDAPHGTVYVPLFGGQDSVPHSYTMAKQSVFTPGSAWWAFNFVNNWVAKQFNVIHPEIVTEQQRLHGLAESLMSQLDQKDKEGEKGMGWYEEQTNAFAEEVVKDWWALAWRIVAKYNNGAIITGELMKDMTIPSYPAWWLKAVGFAKWPGDSFEYPPGTAPPEAPRSGFFGVGFFVLLIAGLAVAGTWGSRGYRKLPSA